MEKYYSQTGEDYLLNQIFKGQDKGFFVEIGCLDGIDFSNTYIFEKKGWKGICIEAHNDFIEQLKKNRVNSTIVHCAVGPENKEKVVFYANKIGSLSTLDKNMEERWNKTHKNFFYGFEEQVVQMKTLTSIFNDLNIYQIDIISLDIEGYEVEALKGLDLSKYQPRIFVIEYKDEVHKRDLESLLFKHGYHFLSVVGCNLFYGKELEDKAILNRNFGKVQLTRFYADGKEYYEEILLKQPGFLDKVKLKLKIEANKLINRFKHAVEPQH